MASALDPYYASRRRPFSLEARLNLVLGRSLYSRDYVQAQRWRTRMINHFYQALQKADVIVTPATGCTAPLIEPDALEQGTGGISCHRTPLAGTPAVAAGSRCRRSCRTQTQSAALPVAAGRLTVCDAIKDQVINHPIRRLRKTRR